MENRKYSTMRQKLYGILDAKPPSISSKIYNVFMMVSIIFSLLPLTNNNDTNFLLKCDEITVTIFIIDYILRLFTADIKYDKKSIISFLRYPFSPMAIIDLLSILPSISIFNSAFIALKMTRFIRLLKFFRVLRFIRYSRSIGVLSNVIRRSRKSLLIVGGFAVGYILISALIIFNIEPQSFSSYFDAVYWATVSLTTVGYGDIYPVTMVGRIIAMISSFLGIAVVALPAGIITAEYVEEIHNK